MDNKCNHSDYELTLNEVADIFQKNYRTILLWYNNDKFPNAYKCRKCNRIYIPVSDVKKILEKEKGL